MSITYTPSTNFGAKDSLPSNDSNKVIRGSEFTTEFTAIQTAFGLAAPAASPTFTGTVTIASVDINGGNIDGTTIGGTTPAAGTFSSLTATTADINGGTIDGVTIGGSSAGAITGTTITGTSFVSSGDMTFGDNNKAIFGAGSDLEIYHDGSNSYIEDAGAGVLFIKGTGGVYLRGKDSNEDLGRFLENGAVDLYYDGSSKLATTATGIDVTGTVTADGLTVEGTGTYLVSLNNTSQDARLELKKSGTQYGQVSVGTNQMNLVASGASTVMRFVNDAGEAARIDSSGRLFVGATTGVGNDRVLIATDSSGTYSQCLNLKDTNASANGNYFLVVRKSDDTYVGALRRSGTDNAMLIEGNSYLNFATASAANAMRLDASGNLLVGASTFSFVGSNDCVQISGTEGRINIENDTASTAYAVAFYNTNGLVGRISTSGSATSYVTSSDQRLKDNIVDAPSASDDIDAIQVRSFDWKADGSHQRYGMVAQELMTVAPEAVSGAPESDDMMGVDYSKLVPMLVKEIQSLRARVAQLEGV